LPAELHPHGRAGAARRGSGGGRPVPKDSTGPRRLRPPGTLRRMSIGLALGLVAALCWGSTDVTAALSGRRLGSPRVAAILQVTTLVVVLVLCVVRSTGLPANPADTIVACVAGAFAAGAYLSFFTALRIGPVSVVSPVVAAYGGLTVVLAV